MNEKGPKMAVREEILETFPGKYTWTTRIQHGDSEWHSFTWEIHASQ